MIKLKMPVFFTAYLFKKILIILIILIIKLYREIIFCDESDKISIFLLIVL